MPILVWDELDERFYETGVDRGVLYTPIGGEYTSGVVWNGLTGVTASPTGAEATNQYADNIKYVSITSAEEFTATIEAFTFPPEFLKFDGVAKTANGMQIGQQGRPTFGFGWRTKKGNALDEDAGYVINLAYGCQAAPSERAHKTINDSPELATFSWSLTTTPVNVTGYKPSAIIRIDSTDASVDPDGLADLEEILYGSATNPARLPMPDEIDTILAGA